MRFLLVTLVLACTLAGCAPGASDGTAIPVSSLGQTIGTLRPLKRAESRVSFEGYDAFVVERAGGEVDGRWVEMMGGNTFRWRYEAAGAKPFPETITNEERLAFAVNQMELRQQVNIPSSGYRIRRMNAGGLDISYTVIMGFRWNCLAFGSVSGGKAFHGWDCLANPGSFLIDLESRLRQTLRVIRFDDGAINRSKN